MTIISLPPALEGFLYGMWAMISRSPSRAEIVIALLIVILVFGRRSTARSVSINLPFSLGSATFDTSPTDRILAWKLYVQLVTRKAAIPFDDQHDVIVDVYDSLFELFGITRELLLELPPREFARPEGLASVMLRVLNDGVRPHLTRWQADYRRWYAANSHDPAALSMSPQNLQRTYPRYEPLVQDLNRTNTELSKLADELKEMATTRQKRPTHLRRPVPRSPAVTSGRGPESAPEH